MPAASHASRMGSGQMLAWQEATLAQRVNDWAVVLHTGQSAWLWAVVLGLAGASVLLFWLSGVVIWWQTRRLVPRIQDNSAPGEADALIFVASEGGSTWGFARTLHDALVRAGHRVHSEPLERLQTTAATRLVFVLAALLTPPDPVSQCIMAAPMLVLYFAGVATARLARKAV